MIWSLFLFGLYVPTKMLCTLYSFTAMRMQTYITLLSNINGTISNTNIEMQSQRPNKKIIFLICAEVPSSQSLIFLLAEL